MVQMSNTGAGGRGGEKWLDSGDTLKTETG